MNISTKRSLYFGSITGVDTQETRFFRRTGNRRRMKHTWFTICNNKAYAAMARNRAELLYLEHQACLSPLIRLLTVVGHRSTDSSKLDAELTRSGVATAKRASKYHRNQYQGMQHPYRLFYYTKNSIMDNTRVCWLKCPLRTAITAIACTMYPIETLRPLI